MNLWQQLVYKYQQGSIIIKLIFINVAVFLVSNIVFALASLFEANLSHYFYQYTAVHSNLKDLLFTPWTVITYAFLHKGLFHILFNMLWLYWIGSILEEYIGSRKILPVYIYGAVFGALLYVFAYNVFPLFESEKYTSFAIGASAGVMAIIWATVTLLPEYEVRLFLLGSVKLIWLAAIMLALDLINVSGSNAGGAIAHIGGAFMGFLFIYLYRNGNDLSIGFNKVLDSITNLFQPKPKSHLKVKYKRKQKQQTRSSATANKKQENNVDHEAKLNAILDKINESGYDGLTKAEKDFLFRKSNSE